VNFITIVLLPAGFQQPACHLTCLAIQ
jgi:hypothetical protein